MGQAISELKVIWAFDPFSADLALQRLVIDAVRALSKKANIMIEPISLIHTHSDGATYGDPNFQLIRESSAQKIERIVGPDNSMTVLPVRIICEPTTSQRKGVKNLVEYAKSADANLIVTATHSRKGYRRWLSGNFSETLILSSDLPLLVVNPVWKKVPYFKHILFPTDFSDESKSVFHRVLAFAKKLDCDLTIFHKPPLFSYPYSAELGWISQEYYWKVSEVAQEQSKIQIKEQASQWLKEARSVGVRASLKIDSQAQTSIADAIMEYSKEVPGLVAMAAQSGVVKADLLGSVTRQVVRECTSPVWVLHSSLSAAKEETQETSFFTDQPSLSMHPPA